jgi:hypothetical protein
MTIASATALLIGGAAVLTFAAPAFAATAANTPVTVTVTGGALGISAPTASVLLGTPSGSASAQTVTAPLGTVLVTDARAGIAGWVATVGSTDFTGPTPILAGAVAYTPGAPTVGGIATVTPGAVTALSNAVTTIAQTATAVSGVNTASWIPSIAVTIPAGALAGSYGATITHSVS